MSPSKGHWKEGEYSEGALKTSLRALKKMSEEKRFFANADVYVLRDRYPL
jgi:hypothetical protein